MSAFLKVSIDSIQPWSGGALGLPGVKGPRDLSADPVVLLDDSLCSVTITPGFRVPNPDLSRYSTEVACSTSFLKFLSNSSHLCTPSKPLRDDLSELWSRNNPGKSVPTYRRPMDNDSLQTSLRGMEPRDSFIGGPAPQHGLIAAPVKVDGSYLGRRKADHICT